MSDDKGSGLDGTVGDDTSSRYTQALRFLISLQSQKEQDTDAQRAFLRSKGLSEQEIENAFEEIKRPEIMEKDGLVKAKSVEESGLSDADAFDHAAKAFDDPLHSNMYGDDSTSVQQTSNAPPSLPPRTYPRSPLALYQQPGQNDLSNSSIDNPLTRYHVLLRFFRSFCYFLVLGGGVTSIAVALYRAYMMPRLIATLDARSSLLQHHRSLFSTLAGRVKSLKNNSLAPASTVQELQQQQEGATGAPPLKGVLKKVQFADEVETKAVSGNDSKGTHKSEAIEEEEKKESGETTALLGEKEAGEDASEKSIPEKEGGENATAEEKNVEEIEKPALPPINILESLQSSLARLNQALKADVSASAIGSEIGSVRNSSTTSLATTVEEEGDAWVSDEDSDELEFDPFAPPSTKAKSSKRKHSPKNNVSSSKSSADRPSASGTSSSTLKSTLNSVNAYINTQTYMANANVFGSRSLGIGSSGSTDSNASKSGEVAQVRAEIRSLKGLLLSRRNFPIYQRPTPPPQPARVEPTA
ncbi:uncharacterized protein FA14DRAFT_162450 [Meira miltonrushii]|uniref:Peroxisome membrane anchor protein Pex14p N-terminal domain-containing protein n=1 Tax=Meira miltonrushii TaxID=1280837 RepID=A0A316V499_9BASI|nr:uncharacterized protein FA14DRAFT_162450 [Meira miltonrushii]PWN32282.1 hypothetical protein FA14DRAFT_162450 [Meira miltonrushii]